jgi:hypothetical protein
MKSLSKVYWRGERLEYTAAVDGYFATDRRDPSLCLLWFVYSGPVSVMWMLIPDLYCYFLADRITY